MQEKGLKKRVKILKVLEDHDFISGERIAKICKISRIAVWKHISYLIKNGVQIRVYPNKGYQLLDLGDRLLPESVHMMIANNNLVKNIVYFNEVDSTNDAAKQILKSGTLVIAEQQKRGRGRCGREWKSEKYKDILCSLITSPKLPYHYLPIFNIIGALSVAIVLNKLFKVKAKTKWPNDVLINGIKIAGILVESVAELDLIEELVLGIGIDVNSHSRHSGSSSLSSILKKEKLDRLKILIAVLGKLSELFGLIENRDFTGIQSLWKKYSLDFGNNIKTSQEGITITGKSRGIDTFGNLIIKGNREYIVYPASSIKLT
ncbi:MAG: biotin--[acetyl-CoA-carboxylase] ligase [Candidatus Omnitrophica bacterium]|nr:biotin--[acetyl-CoA-carboxylase] ligase [Candidatus Omnitrophota bacterium]